MVTFFEMIIEVLTDIADGEFFDYYTFDEVVCIIMWFGSTFYAFGRVIKAIINRIRNFIRMKKLNKKKINKVQVHLVHQ